MALTPEEKAVLQTRLSEAEAALHDWTIGTKARTFQDANGERVEYSVEGMRRLPGYIADLKRQLGVGCAAAPMRPYFL